MRQPDPKFGDLVQLVLFGATGYYGLVTEKGRDGCVVVRVGNGLEAEFRPDQLDPVPLHFNATQTTNFAESVRRPTGIGDIRMFAVFGEVAAEREYQDSQWGGPNVDDTRSEEDWIEWICEYARALSGRSSRHQFRARMLKVAALAVAAIEVHDRLAVDPPTGQVATP